jgi:hypothetical protein
MTERNEERRERSRRAVLRPGGVGSGGLALGLSGAGAAAGDEAATRGDAARQQYPVGKALMFHDEFRPGARFRVVSPVVAQRPDVEAVQNQDVWASANTRIIEYLNTGERVSLFPIEQADVEQGQVYELSSRTLALFDREAGIVSCEYALPGSGSDASATAEDFETVEGGGKALITATNFHPGALFRVVSDVVDWTPRQNVQGSDVFSSYDTRYGEYRNTSDRFLFYPAHSADFERDAVYVMRDEFDVTAPEGALLTADVDRVDPASLDDA